MWQRFTESARRAVFHAKQEAERLGENQVRAEHILLGVLREDHSVANRLLREMQIEPGELARQVVTIITPGPGRDETDLRLDDRAKRVIDLAQEEARRLGNKYIGTEHLLLGLLAAQVGPSGAVFRYHGPELDAARRTMDAMLGEHPHRGVVAPVGGMVGVRTRASGGQAANSPRWWILALLVMFVWWLISHL